MSRTSSVYVRVEPEIKEQAEISKGMKSIEAGRVYSAETIEAEMMRDFGV